jgi:hypothetical protein
MIEKHHCGMELPEIGFREALLARDEWFQFLLRFLHSLDRVILSSLPLRKRWLCNAICGLPRLAIVGSDAGMLVAFEDLVGAIVKCGIFLLLVVI